MRREKALDTVKEFPEEFELDDLIEKLVFIEKVEEGLNQLYNGNTVPHIAVKEMVKKW